MATEWRLAKSEGTRVEVVHFKDPCSSTLAPSFNCKMSRHTMACADWAAYGIADAKAMDPLSMSLALRFPPGIASGYAIGLESGML